MRIRFSDGGLLVKRMQVVIFIDDSDDDNDVRASCVILRPSGSGSLGTYVTLGDGARIFRFRRL